MEKITLLIKLLKRNLTEVCIVAVQCSTSAFQSVFLLILFFPLGSIFYQNSQLHVNSTNLQTCNSGFSYKKKKIYNFEDKLLSMFQCSFINKYLASKLASLLSSSEMPISDHLNLLFFKFFFEFILSVSLFIASYHIVHLGK